MRPAGQWQWLCRDEHYAGPASSLGRGATDREAVEDYLAQLDETDLRLLLTYTMIGRNSQWLPQIEAEITARREILDRPPDVKTED
jgi:hypothetical protein